MTAHCRHPEIEVELVGRDGNIFNVLGICQREMRRAGLSKDERSAFMDEATSADYNHALATCMRWFNVS
jgi:hypothetical protein